MTTPRMLADAMGQFRVRRNTTEILLRPGLHATSPNEHPPVVPQAWHNVLRTIQYA